MMRGNFSTQRSGHHSKISTSRNTTINIADPASFGLQALVFDSLKVFCDDQHED